MNTQTFDFKTQCISCQSPHIALNPGDKVLWERNSGRTVRNPNFRIKATVVRELPNTKAKTWASRKVVIAARYRDDKGGLFTVEHTIERWKLYRYDWRGDEVTQ